MSFDAAHRIQLAACPPIDCQDGYLSFIFEAEEAYRQLAQLGPKGIVAQAISMTAYLNKLHGTDWQIEAVLNRWRATLIRQGLTAVVQCEK